MKKNPLKYILSAVALSAVFIAQAAANDLPELRVGVLKFGTVNWELDTIKNQQLAKANGFKLHVVPLASNNATKVALQGGAADMIVSDWIWVSRQRAEGKHYTFIPYSNAVGAVMVADASPIKQVTDLAGKTIGIAGGPVDKSWLLLRAHYQKITGKDLKDSITPQFAAPPLLNEIAKQGDVDAALNFWHYNARLKASGMRTLIDIPQMLKSLEIDGPIPLLGWVVSDEFADKNQALITQFIQASYQAKSQLRNSDTLWLALKKRMKATDNETLFTTLRDEFRQGIPECLSQKHIDEAAKAYALMASIGGKQLVGDAKTLSEGTFWADFPKETCQKILN